MAWNLSHNIIPIAMDGQLVLYYIVLNYIHMQE